MATLPTLDEIASDGAYMLSDDMDDEEFDRFAAKSVEDRVRYLYCAAECDVFAVALHRLVEAPDGRLLDAGGWQSLKTLSRRYEGASPILSQPGDETLAIGYIEETIDGMDQGLARAVAAIRQLPGAPFSEDWFRKLSGQQLDGVDIASGSHRTP